LPSAACGKHFECGGESWGTIIINKKILTRRQGLLV
jgi:hypothetical protein